MTEPDAAAAFVDETRVDLLAVSVGNIHIMVKGGQPLDLERLAAIRKRVPTPLVLHGGSGIESGSLKAAIAMGCTKVNYGTYLKQRYLAALGQSFAQRTTANPHELLGIGGDHDLMVAGRLAVRDAVLERIDLLGCCERA
jgi:fructose/tagatose bisphosphate aldolase